MNFQETNQIYENTRCLFGSGIEFHKITSRESEAFFKAFVLFAEGVQKSQVGGEWEKYVRLLKCLYWRFLCSPVSFSSILDTRRSRLDELNKQLRASIGGLPEVGQAYAEMIRRAKALIEMKENPLVEVVNDWARAKDSNFSVLMIVPESSIVQLSREALGQIADKWVICPPSAVRQCLPCDGLLFFGPPTGLFRTGNGYILRSPLGKQIINFSIANISVAGIAPSLLDESRKIPVRPCGDERNTVESLMADEDMKYVLPVGRDWSALLKGELTPGFHKEGELYAECRVVLLGGGNLVPLDTDSSRWTLTVGRAGTGSKCVGIHRTDTESLIPGELIVLTTESSGDLLKPYADKVLGKKAASINGLQSSWKRALHKRVQCYGMGATVKALNELGCSIASPANIRNWCSDTHIATRDLDTDLGAILHLTGLDSRKNDVFQAVKMLYQARIAASVTLHKSLLASLVGQDLSEVMTRGFMEVKREEGGPAKTVYRIEEIRDGVVSIPVHRVNRVEAIEEHEQ